jgi:hypothetical protein
VRRKHQNFKENINNNIYKSLQLLRTALWEAGVRGKNKQAHNNENDALKESYGELCGGNWAGKPQKKRKRKEKL